MHAHKCKMSGHHFPSNVPEVPLQMVTKNIVDAIFLEYIASLY